MGYPLGLTDSPIMLVCAKCEFENPEHNRFCQNCGHPLRIVSAIVMRQASTDACDPAPSTDGISAAAASIATEPPATSDINRFALEHSGTDDSTLAAHESDDKPEDTASHPSHLTAAAASTPLSGEFLDAANRYQLQSPQVERPVAPGQELEAEVIDCHPGDPSPLDALQTALLEAESSTESIEVTLMEQLPVAAHPYIKLQNKLFPVLPELYAAWQQDDYTVLLLENRTQLTQLSDTWSDQIADPLQQVHWFFEMTDLWHALAPWHGQASLLKQDNLCVDEDRILCLRRLYCQPTPNGKQLIELGQFWEDLLRTLPNVLAPLKQLAHDVAGGEIDQLQPLQSELAQIADTLQAQSQPELVLNPESIPKTETEASPDSWEADEQGDLDAEAVSNKPEASVSESGVEEQSSRVIAETDSDNTADLETVLEEDIEAVSTNLHDVAASLIGTDINNNNELPPPDEEDETDFAESTMVLPMVLVGLDEAGQTHVGQQRDHNEDSFYIRTELHKQEIPSGRKLAAKGLYILCDGMGGHEGGEVASALAVQTLQAYFEQHWGEDLPPEESIQTAIAEANRAIYDLNIQDERSGSGRMGTTLVMVLLQDTQAVVAHVGDSRLYRYSRRLGLQQATIDHEVGQREIKRGVEPAIAYARPDAYQLTQALGPRDSEDIRPSVNYIDLNEDTLFVLCSDGLSDNDLLETHCTSHVDPLLRSRHDLEEGVADLIELANVQNGHDNITVIAVRVKVRPNLEKLRN